MSGLTRRVIGAVAMDAPLTFQLLLGHSFMAAFARYGDYERNRYTLRDAHGYRVLVLRITSPPKMFNPHQHQKVPPMTHQADWDSITESDDTESGLEDVLTGIEIDAAFDEKSSEDLPYPASDSD